MKFLLLTLFALQCAFAQNHLSSERSFPSNPAPTHHHHTTSHTGTQNVAQNFNPVNNAPGNVRRGRWLADPFNVDPIYKSVWSPSVWPDSDASLYYSPAPVSGHKVVTYGSEHVVPAWKFAEPVSSWKVAPYSSSWKMAPKEESWKVVGVDKWDSSKWISDEKVVTGGWSDPSVVVPTGPSFYSASPVSTVSWSSPVVKKQQWSYVQSVPKSISYYGVQPVVGAYSGKYKWAKPIDGVYEDSVSYVPKPFHYSSSVVHEKPISAPFY